MVAGVRFGLVTNDWSGSVESTIVDRPSERHSFNVSIGRYRVNRVARSPAGLTLAIYAASARQQTIGRRRHVPRPTARTGGGKHSGCISCYEGFRSQACTGFFLPRCLARRMEVTGQEGASIRRSGVCEVSWRYRCVLYNVELLSPAYSSVAS